LAWFLVYAGLELLGFMISIVYLGAILVFFIFVIMLIDLRFEDLQEIYPEARMSEPQDYPVLLPFTIFFNVFILNCLVERLLYKEYFGLERLIFVSDTAGLTPMELQFLSEAFVSNTTSPAAIGFFMFSTEGAAVGVLALVILLSLYVSLYTVQTANDEVITRLATNDFTKRSRVREKTR
jgi:NADH:ubiquinone oxidoreductase subunit 6 (subunit J)